MIGIRIRRTERDRERYVRWGRRGEIRHRWRSRGAFNCRGPYGSREASVVHEKRYIFLTPGVWHLGRCHEEEARQTIRVERISSRMQLSRVDSTDIPLDNVHKDIDASRLA